jgi:hypothetical protein
MNIRPLEDRIVVENTAAEEDSRRHSPAGDGQGETAAREGRATGQAALEGRGAPAPRRQEGRQGRSTASTPGPTSSRWTAPTILRENEMLAKFE